jgi:hypothetical protein
MKDSPVLVRLPAYEAETVPPVTILDADGRVIRVVPAAVFRSSAPMAPRHWHERRRRFRRPGSAPAEKV